MYPQIRRWLSRRLKEELPRRKIVVEDTHNSPLRVVIPRLGLTAQYRDYAVWDIRVDLTGFIIGPESSELVLVECKKGAASLKDLGQLLGYSLVAKPMLSLLVSPAGPSEVLAKLILSYNRYDILGYAENRSIAILTWDYQRGCPRAEETIPRGALAMKLRG